jgi:putative addiction module component (TIGR02574 family)
LVLRARCRPSTTVFARGLNRYNRTMKRDAAEILKDALALPSEARAALAGSLLESLDTEVDEDAEAAWAAEVNRRVAELDSSAVKTIPWAEVRRRLAAR